MKIPAVTGPFEVGATDILTDSVLFRLFYPTEKRGNRAPWMPRTWMYTYGYLNFVRIPGAVAAFVAPFMHFTRATYSLNVPLSEKKQRFPVIVFSHGLGGMRTTYSYLCSEFASHGFVVAAVEHNDGSGCYSLREKKLYHVPAKKDIPADQTAAEFYMNFRQGQIRSRYTEMAHALDILDQLNAATATESLLKKTSDNSKDIDVHPELLNFLNGSLDMDRIVLVGHSYGAATCAAALQDESKGKDGSSVLQWLGKVKTGILLDPWMHAVHMDRKVSVPVLSIQTETFHWKMNIDHLKTYFDDCLMQKEKSENLVVLGTAHQDCSDLPVLFPSIMRRMKLGGPKDARESILVMLKASLDYIRRHLEGLDSLDFSQTIRDAIEQKEIIDTPASFDFLYNRLGPNDLPPY